MSPVFLSAQLVTFQLASSDLDFVQGVESVSVCTQPCRGPKLSILAAHPSFQFINNQSSKAIFCGIDTSVTFLLNIDMNVSSVFHKGTALRCKQDAAVVRCTVLVSCSSDRTSYFGIQFLDGNPISVSVNIIEATVIKFQPTYSSDYLKLSGLEITFSNPVVGISFVGFLPHIDADYTDCSIVMDNSVFCALSDQLKIVAGQRFTLFASETSLWNTTIGFSSSS